MTVFGDLPEPQHDWAVFLDVDGTLIEIAPTPADASADPSTVSLLRSLSARSGGAVALVSGRPLAELDRLFEPLRLPAAGLHGLERRTGSGDLVQAEFDGRALSAARTALEALARRLAGILLEDKGAALAVHYRQAPQHEAEVLAAARRLADESGGSLHLLTGKMVAELRARGPDKGDVVRDFMAEPPFHGRVPVFIGDDVTDEDGFRAVNELGGESIRVGASTSTAAAHSIADPAQLKSWLRAAVSRGIDV